MALQQVQRTSTTTLLAGIVTTIQGLVTVNGFRVFNLDPTAKIYGRTDNVDPVVGGDGSFVVLPGEHRWFTNLPDSSNPEIRLITSGVSVACVVEGDFTE